MTADELLSLRSEIAALRNELHTIKKRQGDQRSDIDTVIQGVADFQTRIETLQAQVAQVAIASTPVVETTPPTPEVSK